jgi:hypothetical protein
MMKTAYQALVTSGIQNPNTWSQRIKHEIAVYGTTIEAEITGIDWGKEVSKRAVGKPNDKKERYMMIEDDMSFMEPIFLERQLPFPEYLELCGYHAMTQEVINKYNDPLNNKDHEAKRSALEGMLTKYGKHFRAVYRFPCKGGASISVSVISGKMFYSKIDAPYEIMGVALNEGEDGDEPMPYQTDEQLMIYLAKVLAHSQEY